MTTPSPVYPLAQTPFFPARPRNCGLASVVFFRSTSGITRATSLRLANFSACVFVRSTANPFSARVYE